jgi:hypothetical protein
MPAHTVDYKGDDFSLCIGNITQNSKFSLYYRNVQNPESMNGNVTQWLYLTKGSGKIIIHGEYEVDLPVGQLIKTPNLINKKVTWVCGDEDVNWVSFNPIPRTDNYDAAQFTVLNNSPLELQTTDYDRFAVLLEGECTIKNANKEIKMDVGVAVKVNNNSAVIISSSSRGVVGIFWKTN